MEQCIHGKTYRLEKEFSIVPNKISHHTQLSWAAKGLLLYFLSLPEKWKINTKHLCSIYQGNKRGNGKEAILSCINELKEQGYVIFERVRTEDGKFLFCYHVFTHPYSEFQKMFPESVKPDLVNADVYKGKSKVKKEKDNSTLPIPKASKGGVRGAEPPGRETTPPQKSSAKKEKMPALLVREERKPVEEDPFEKEVAGLSEKDRKSFDLLKGDSQRVDFLNLRPIQRKIFSFLTQGMGESVLFDPVQSMKVLRDYAEEKLVKAIKTYEERLNRDGKDPKNPPGYFMEILKNGYEPKQSNSNASIWKKHKHNFNRYIEKENADEVYLQFLSPFEINLNASAYEVEKRIGQAYERLQDMKDREAYSE